MTETVAAPTVASRQRYRRLLFGSVIGGSVIGVALRTVGYPVVGEAVYWLGILGFLAAWRFSPVPLFDERDRAIERRASTLTLTLAAAVLVVAASAARMVSVLGVYEVPTVVWGALYGYVGLFVLFAVAFVWTKYGR